jgi:hypothetical protein
MSVESTAFRWTEPKERAAVLVAQDQLPDLQIADEVGVSERQLERWKTHPEFRARVEEHVTAIRQAIRARGIAVVENRVQALQDRWEGLKRVIRERAEEMDGETPGGGTGLLVRQIKSVGAGPLAREVTEYAVDTGLLRELREHEKQAAQELGQWAEKQEITGKNGEPFVVKILRGVSTDDL